MKWALGIAVTLLVGAVAVFTVVPGELERSRNQVLAHATPRLSDEALALHARLVVGDLHTDSTLWSRDLRQRGDRGHVDLPRLREGNVALQAFTFVTRSPKGQNYESNDADASDNITPLVLLQRWPFATWSSLTERALFQAGKLADIAKAEPGSLRILRSRSDLAAVMQARESGAETIGALLGIEGAHALDGAIDNIERLHNAGVRMFGLHHFFDNALGGSLHGTGGGGLTPFGREVVSRLIARDAIIDVAHSSEQSVRDVLAMSDRPLVVSHSGFYGYCPTPRNIADELMQQIASEGGLIGVGYWDAAVCEVSAAGIVGAIRYGIDLLGVDHVALGSDYDGTTTVPFDTSELAMLTDEMLKQDFSEEEISQVMGGNMLRFLRENLPAAGATAPAGTNARVVSSVRPSSVMIMSFNVENLFDATNDPKKYDDTFLPLSAKQTDEHKAYCAHIRVDQWRDNCLNTDWSEDVVERKLSVLAKAILQVGDGRGPDIIALQEIENIAILERLRTEYLQEAGYKAAILIEGEDERGIDVA